MHVRATNAHLRSLVRLFALLIKKRSRHAVVGFEFLKKTLSTQTEMHGKQIYF